MTNETISIGKARLSEMVASHKAAHARERAEDDVLQARSVALREGDNITSMSAQLRNKNRFELQLRQEGRQHLQGQRITGLSKKTGLESDYHTVELALDLLELALQRL